MALGQYIRACGGRSVLSTPLSQPGSTESGYLQVVPSVCVSERYDSNVFYRQATPGLTRNDFVTNVSPSLLVNHNGDYASGFLNVSGFSETYANNTSLNYFGTSNSLFLNLDNSIKRLFPNASLTITDVMRYAPSPPGYASLAAGTSPGDPSNISNAFAQGFLMQRTNNVSNTGTVLASYATTASTTVDASYTYALLRFGASPGVPQTTSSAQPTLFDNTTQTGTVGARIQVSGLDILNPIFSHTQVESTPVSGGKSSLFKVDSATIRWTRTLTPYFMAEVGGGGILIDPGITTYAVNAALIMNLQTSSATISYARSTYPSIQSSGGPLVADIFSLSAIQNPAQLWQLTEAVNYAHGSNSGISYDSYFASVDAHYWITQIWSTALSYEYMKYNSESGAVSQVWARNALILSVKATWE